MYTKDFTLKGDTIYIKQRIFIRCEEGVKADVYTENKSAWS